MSIIIPHKNFRQSAPFIFLTFWSVLLLANFIPAIPQPEIIIGYLWKIEFALAAFLLAAIFLFLKLPKERFVTFSKNEFFHIILPLLLFTAWSGFSVFWAQSSRAALHHTLLWACYCVFYLLIRQIVSRPKYLSAAFKVTGTVFFVLGIACIFEFVNNPEDVNPYFTYRYYKYAEAAVTLLPMFLALALQTKSRTSLLCGSVAAAAWLIVLLSLSRTMFIAGIICIAAFFAFTFLFSGARKHLKKSVLLAVLLLACFFISQINFSSARNDNSTLNRLSGTEASQTNFKSRFLFWGVAFEAFKTSPVSGVGADNFGAAYGKARENYSSKNEENRLLEINEDILAERAHNEFLQILSELGAVGAILFLWLLFGAARLFLTTREKPVSLLSIAAFAGIIGFFISSMASSYSFRVPANGLCFFFVLALLVGNSKLKAQSSKPVSSPNSEFKILKLKPAFLTAGLFICSSMLIFSALRGASLMYLQFALASEKTQAEQYLQKTIALDSSDASFRYYYGIHLFNSERIEESIPQLQLAVDSGFATSITCFNLASAQIISRNNDEAEKTFAEALRIYPRSVFLRTAFAAFLKENKKDARAQSEYEKALKVNEAQAKSWLVAHTEGVAKLAQISSADKSFVKAMHLKPDDAVYALLDFQRQFNPNLVRR